MDKEAVSLARKSKTNKQRGKRVLEDNHDEPLNKGEALRKSKSGPVDKRVVLRRTLRSFWLRNRFALTCIAVVFIVVEGTVLWFYPAQWWKPLISALAVGSVLMMWKNLKSVVKGILSFVLTILMASLAVQSGYAYGGPDVAAIWGMSILTGWALTILITYFYKPIVSRWMVSLIAVVMGFSAGYVFMVLGVVAIGVSSILTMVMVTVCFMGWEAWMRRLGKSVKPDGHWLDSSRRNVTKAIESLWPGISHTRMKLLGSWSTTVFYGAGSPTIVVVPLALDESFKTSKMYGITYHHRGIRNNALWLVETITDRVGEPAPVVMFVDVNGANEATRETGDIMAFTMTDSLQSVYAGIIDGSCSVNKTRKAITKVVKSFQGLRYADEKQAESIRKNIDRYYEKHLMKEHRKNNEDPDSGEDIVMDENNQWSMVSDDRHPNKDSRDETSKEKDGTVLDEDKLNAALDKVLKK